MVSKALQWIYGKMDTPVQMKKNVHETEKNSLTVSHVHALWVVHVQPNMCILMMYGKDKGMITSFRGEYAWLSNFYESPVVVYGKRYRNAEAAFQAGKCRYLPDMDKFSNLSGVEAKQLGKRITLIDDWNETKLSYMLTVLRAKFAQNPELNAKLVATGDEQIVEGNTWGDTFWGVCNGKGENHLGKLLMWIRDEEQ